MPTTTRAAAAALFLVACSGDDGPGGSAPDAGDADTDSDADADTDTGEPDAGGSTDAGAPFDFASPSDGDDLLFSAAVEIVGGAEVETAQVSVTGEETPRCTWDARPFVCLVDLTTVPAGPSLLDARGLAGGVEVATAQISITRREPPLDPCGGAGTRDCVTNLALAGSAAGWTGLSYHDMDDGHAAYDTSAMVGIESKINHLGVGADPWHRDEARIVVANQSEAYVGAEGTWSIPRGIEIGGLEELWEESKIFLWPEHRDHGVADFYPWMVPTLVLSQGSSGSELDEIGKLLFILGAFASADLRSQMHEAAALMPALTMIHRRARVATDLEYVSAAAHPAAFMDAASDVSGITLAQAVRAEEIPPVANVSIEEETVPATWDDAGFAPILEGIYARAWAPPAAPAASPAGTFEAVVDLEGSLDANGRRLVFFASLVRGDPAHARVTRIDRSRFRVDFEWPEDHAEVVAGQSRTSRRATFAFFAHNGVWLSAPAFVSIFGADPYAPAPDANNLD